MTVSIVTMNHAFINCAYILIHSYVDITFGFSAAHSVVNETEGDVEICIDIIHGALERDVSVYLQTMPITGSGSI